MMGLRSEGRGGLNTQPHQKNGFALFMNHQSFPFPLFVPFIRHLLLGSEYLIAMIFRTLHILCYHRLQNYGKWLDGISSQHQRLLLRRFLN